MSCGIVTFTVQSSLLFCSSWKSSYRHIVRFFIGKALLESERPTTANFYCLGTRQKTKVPSCQVVVPLPAGRVDWVVASLGGPGRTGFV